MPVNWPPIADHVWDGIRTEFTLPTVAQVRHRLSELIEDPEPSVAPDSEQPDVRADR